MQDQLRRELIALRGGSGMTVQDFSRSPVLMKAFGAESRNEAFDAIKALLDRHDDKWWNALRNAYGLGEFSNETITDRRADYPIHYGVHPDTVERWENVAIGQLEAILTGDIALDQLSKGRPGGYSNILRDGSWVLCVRDCNAVWDWEAEERLLILLHSGRFPRQLKMHRDAGECSLDLRNDGETLLFQTWPDDGDEFAVALSWGRHEYPPFVRLNVDGQTSAALFEDGRRLEFLPPEGWSEIVIDWWWFHEPTSDAGSI